MSYRGGMTAAEIVREARTSVGLTQRQLAQLAGVPHSTVARIETGAIDPRFGTVDRLVRACGRALRTISPWDGDDDESLIRVQLGLSPGERLESMANASKAASKLRESFEAAAK
jgi:transcriptional regulator with XRE-family HTH domain